MQQASIFIVYPPLSLAHLPHLHLLEPSAITNFSSTWAKPAYILPPSDRTMTEFHVNQLSIACSPQLLKRPKNGGEWGKSGPTESYILHAPEIKKMKTIHHGAFEHDIFVFGECYMNCCNTLNSHLFLVEKYTLNCDGILASCVLCGRNIIYVCIYMRPRL